MDLLIKGALIIDCDQTLQGDVYIEDGIIREVGENITKDCKVINANGYTLLPAFVDLHSHFRDPGLTYKEDLESGCRAAVCGGYTTVNLMANTKPICSSMEVVKYVRDKSSEIGLIDIHQTVSITKNFDGYDLSHIECLDSGVKCISDDGKGVMNASAMYKAMIKAKGMSLTVMCHEEDDGLSGIDYRLAENIMTFRDIELAKVTGCHLHISHVSTKEAIGYVIEAKKQHYKITCEVTPHHLALDSETEYRVNPPLRESPDIDALIDGIKMGYVDAIATDHAPHSIDDKANGAPGISGIETSFSVCYTKLVRGGHVSLNKLSELMSKNPARMLGYSKGEIKPGFIGDVVLIDTNSKFRVDPSSFYSKGKNTPFNGCELFGRVMMTIRNGNIVYEYKEVKVLNGL